MKGPTLLTIAAVVFGSEWDIKAARNPPFLFSAFAITSPSTWLSTSDTQSGFSLTAIAVPDGSEYFITSTRNSGLSWIALPIAFGSSELNIAEVFFGLLLTLAMSSTRGLFRGIEPTAATTAVPIRSIITTALIADWRLRLCLSLIHISEPTRLGMISYAVFCLKKKKT